MTEHGLPRQRGERCLSDAKLDALTHEELSAGDASDAQQHLDSCVTCRTRHTELTNARDAWRARSLPSLASLASSPAAPAPRVEQAKVLPFRRPSMWAGGTVAVAMAASLLLLIRTEEPSRDDVTFRTKGDIALSVFVESDQGARELVVGDSLYAGDRLRFAVSGAGDGLALVVGVDGAGAASVYSPSSGEFSLVGKEGALAGVATLDAVVGQERLVAVVCTTAPPVAEVLDAARHADDNVWPAGCRTVERKFEKRAQR
ncbi:MAG: hypothetical protein ACO3JL_16385 [Myxococcota bacterium]